MKKRRIILEDGRYLIFYTFDDEPAPQSGQSLAEHIEDKEKLGSEGEA